MENAKILTIGIPTYNGALSLKPNIDNLISIIERKKLMHDICIQVSINASTDNSEELCKRYAKYDYFSFIIQKDNLGYDRNVDCVVNVSNTPYVWLLSDNETITEKGFLCILEILKKNNPSYIFVNHNNTPIGKSNGKGYKIYNNNEEFINEMIFSCGLISSNIISRELWIEWNIKKYIDSHWIHMGYIIELLNHSQGNFITVFDTDYIDDSLDSGNSWGGGGHFYKLVFRLLI